MASGWLQQVSETLVSEFSDLPDAAQLTSFLLRLSIAALLGGLLGVEREHKGKAAGVRTHMLVAMGAAMFVLLAQQVGMADADLSRVMQGIIAGVGFLGAGTILKDDDEDKVKGLTTAAGIWLTAAIGVAAGMGRESTAVLGTLLTLAIFTLMPRLVRLIDKPARTTNGKPADPARHRRQRTFRFQAFKRWETNSPS